MTTPPEPAPDTGLDQRVASLESGQRSILEKLELFLGTGRRDPDPEPERPEVSISDEIRKQLDERDRRKPKTEAPAPKAPPEPEQPPKAPVRRVTRALWGDE